MKLLQICICGGGSLGSVCSAIFAADGHDVNILTGHPERWSDTIEVKDPKDNIFKGHIKKISNKPNEVIPGSDIILLCLPGYLIEETLYKIKPYLSINSFIGSVVSNTGFFLKAHEILQQSQPLFGFQRVPFIARVSEYGRKANLLGYKNKLKAVVENCEREQNIKMLSSLFRTPVLPLNNYLEVTLSNSNPILHTGRLYSLWKDYENEIFENPILFYSEWDDESSEIVLKMDNEFVRLRNALGISSDNLPSLLDYYEVSSSTEFTKKINSIQAFKDIVAPLKKLENGYIPDFKSRYFTEDFPYGLKFIKDLSKKGNISTPLIDKVYEWGMKVMEK